MLDKTEVQNSLICEVLSSSTAVLRGTERGKCVMVVFEFKFKKKNYEAAFLVI